MVSRIYLKKSTKLMQFLANLFSLKKRIRWGRSLINTRKTSLLSKRREKTRKAALIYSSTTRAFPFRPDELTLTPKIYFIVRAWNNAHYNWLHFRGFDCSINIKTSWRRSHIQKNVSCPSNPFYLYNRCVEPFFFPPPHNQTHQRSKAWRYLFGKLNGYSCTLLHLALLYVCMGLFE